MAANDKKGKKTSKGKGDATKGGGSSIADSAADLLGEVEKTAESLAADVRTLFDNLTQKIAALAGSAAETTVGVAQKVSKQPEQLAHRLLEDVKTAGDASLSVIGEGFDSLRNVVSGAVGVGKEEKATAKGRKKKGKKGGKAGRLGKEAKAPKSAKELSAAEAGSAARKAVATKKAAKKATARKAASKKAVAKKVTATKKTAAKKTAAKKSVAKKTAARKAPVRKTASKKAVAKKTVAGGKTTPSTQG